MRSAADLHVHSKYSDRPSEWLLRRIGAPESFVEPAEIYRTCRARGQDFVTITDHNSIDGALEIAHLPGAFISSEVTTYFPEDGCKLHCLVWGISESQFEDIQQARTSVYDLRDLLFDEGIPHAIAHPLYQMNSRMSPENLEKLLLLFNTFEGINGSVSERMLRVFDGAVAGLAPRDIERMADRHGITPRGVAPWSKSLTGGSDDHSGLYIGGACTVTPRAANVDEFLEHLRAGRHEAVGNAATAMQFAHRLYEIAYGYYRERFASSSRANKIMLGALLDGLLEDPEAEKASRGWLKGIAGGFLRNLAGRRLSTIERVLADEFSKLMAGSRGQGETAGALPARDHADRIFRKAASISHQISYALVTESLTAVSGGDLMGGFQAVSSLGFVAFGIAPYFASFKTLHKDDPLVDRVARHFGLTQYLHKSRKRAMFVDACGPKLETDRLIRMAESCARGRGMDITLILCSGEAHESRLPAKTFEPVGVFRVPANMEASLPFPPFLDIMAYVEAERFDELIVATPGPLGLTALAGAWLLGLRTTGLYLCDYARAVGDATQDDYMAAAASRYIAWFYSQTDRVLLAQDAHRQHLCRSMDADKIESLTLGEPIGSAGGL